jgi:YidC/Oxa1 family membrane protein insertase
MTNPRALLWLGLGLLLWLNVNAWIKDYSATPARPTPPAENAAATAAPEQTGTGGLADDLPTVTAETTPATPDAAVAVPQAAVAGAAGARIVHVATDVLDLDLSLAGGELIRTDLPLYPRHKDDPTVPVRLFNTDSKDTQFIFQSGLTSGDASRNEPNHKALFTAQATEFRLAEGSDALEVPLTWSNGAVAVTKTFVFRRGSYAVDLLYRIENVGGEPVRLAPYSQLLRHSPGNERSMWDPETYSFRGPAYYDGEKYQTLDIEDDEDQTLSRTIAGGWVASMQHHFVVAIVPPAGETWQYEMSVKELDYRLRVLGPAQAIPPGGATTIEQKLFVGPKLQEQLKAAGPELDRTVDYGVLWLLAKPLFLLMSWIYKFVGNWGLTIVIVTFLIKLVFYKLSETSGRSMAKMKTVAPRLKAVQERHKDDREAQARAMMDLYKKEKINPVAGCLPMLVQIPFFLAFYWVLLESVEMRQAPFFGWIQDLSSRDPYFILPILMGAAMFAQFKLNPTPPDPIQAKVFGFMPVVMTAMFMWFPSGLVLYWLTNTALSIAQQWKINRVVEAEAKKHRTH